jgi:hypothetical protein
MSINRLPAPLPLQVSAEATSRGRRLPQAAVVLVVVGATAKVIGDGW